MIQSASCILNAVRNPFNSLINLRFTQRFARIIPPRKYQRILPGYFFNCRKSYSTRVDRGTRWGCFIFIRSAGISHTAFSRSNSLQKAPRSSPVRTPLTISRRAARTNRAITPSHLRRIKPLTRHKKSLRAREKLDAALILRNTIWDWEGQYG